ncbi:Mobile element protein (plasmid) [Candidatus Enterovibrio escicola]|uniref:Mobile element protein n=1 Tax=Candidatus Enterovibrio escicola TaxID=1927127 RepID=A0A2A5T787_9GAMM|nr:Mobile element protein [Candidatus Enterovibrio escacola]
MHNLDAIFVDVDDFCQMVFPAWEDRLISSGIKQRNKPSRLSVSELMMIVIAFHQSGYRDYKTYYIHFVYLYLTHPQARPIGITFVDSSKLQVYHNLHILRHQVSKGTLKRGKGTMWWFYSFKLHLIINDQGGIISIKVTMVNVVDRKPVSEMTDELWGYLSGEKGYISGPVERAFADNGVTLITGVK